MSFIDDYEKELMTSYKNVMKLYILGKLSQDKFKIHIDPSCTPSELKIKALEVHDIYSDIMGYAGQMKQIHNYFSSKYKSTFAMMVTSVNEYTEMDEKGEAVIDEDGNPVKKSFKNKAQQEMWIMALPEMQKLQKIIMTSESLEKYLSSVAASLDKLLGTIWTFSKNWTESAN